MNRDAGASRPRGRVLVVDDDPVTLQVVRERLEQAGYEVDVRDTALGTATWTAMTRPDAVLLDVGMPALSGGKLASILSKGKLTSQVSVILHSSMSRPALGALARSVGAAGAIEKTSDSALFMREFERLLHGSAPRS